jgi:hypothetical protein
VDRSTHLLLAMIRFRPNIDAVLLHITTWLAFIRRRACIPETVRLILRANWLPEAQAGCVFRCGQTSGEHALHLRWEVAGDTMQKTSAG